MAADPALRKLYVLGANGSLTVVNGDTNEVAAIEMQWLGFGGGRCGGCLSGQGHTPAVNPNNHMVYLPAGGGMVRVVNGYDNSGVGSVAVGGEPLAAAVMPTSNLVYIANNTSTIPVINSNTNTVFAEISLAGSNAGGNAPVIDVQCDTCGNLVYALRGDGCVSIIDGATHRLKKTFRPEGGAAAIAVDSFLGLLYVIDSAGCAVNVYNTCKRVGVLPVPVHMNMRLSALAVNSVTHLVYIADSGCGVAYIADGGMGNLVATVPVGGDPFAAAVLCCDQECPPGSGCNCGESSAAAMGILTVGGNAQPLVCAVCVAFPNILLEEGGAAFLGDDTHVEIRTPGLYSLTVRVPLRSVENGAFELRYALCVNNAAVFEDRLMGAGPAFQTGFGQFYVRLAPGDVISVPVASYEADCPEGQQIVNAYLAVLRLGK